MKLSIEALEKRCVFSITTPLDASIDLPEQPALVVETAPVAATAGTSTTSGTSPQAAAVAAVTSVRDGLWSDPGVWSTGRVPTATDDVATTHNITIDQAQVRQLDINAGTVTLAGDLHAHGSVVVRSRLVGTHGGIFFHVADDRLFQGTTTPGPDPTSPDFQPQDIGLWGLRGSTIDLQGALVTAWVNAVGSGASTNIGNGVSQQTSFSGGTASLQSAPVGWQAGDTLLLVNEKGESRLATLNSVVGGSIRYHEQKAQPADPDLIGHTLTTEGSSMVVHSKIANLTRRVQIVAADVEEGDTHHRAHTAFLDGANVKLANVEFRDLGPRGKAGRFPIYFDGGDLVQSQLVGSSIWQDVAEPGNRFVAMRDVQGVTVANNVAFRSRGNGFFMQDGGVFGNSIVNNLSVDVSDGEEISIPNSNVTELSHHFWLRTGNTISGNVAAGGDAIGMMVLASNHNTATVVNNAQALGTGLFGMWTGTPNVTFNNPVALYNSRTGFSSDPAWDVDSHGAVLNNPLFLFNGTDDSAYGSQIYLNNSGPITVNGGVLAGEKGVHTHYHSAIVVSKTKIDVETFMTPTYWESSATLDQATIRAELLFERAYPSPRYNSPGIVRFIDTFLDVPGEDAELETADYIGDFYQNYPGLEGDEIPNSIELHHLAPASGFIRAVDLPESELWRSNVRRWTVTPIGQTPVADSFIYHRQSAWEQYAVVGGYPDGFPPGQYEVKLYTEDGELIRTAYAVVRSGQVSDLQDTLTVPGDANGDGQADGADYTIWSANYGRGLTNATLAQGDFTGDGRVNGADYTVWADNANSSPAATLALAETTALAASQPVSEQSQTTDAVFGIALTLAAIDHNGVWDEQGVDRLYAESIDEFFSGIGGLRLASQDVHFCNARSRA